MQLYVIAGLIVAVLGVLVYAAVRIASAARTGVLKDIAQAEADKRRQDDEIDQKPLEADQATDIARRLAASKLQDGNRH